jgi:hypothetical protein
VRLITFKKFPCNKCQDQESKIVELNQVIKKYDIGLDNVLSSQRFSNNKCGLGFSNFDKPSTSQTIFVKTTYNKFNNVEPKKVHGVIRHYGRYDSYLYKNHHVHKPICFYCNKKGHTPSVCYIRNYGVPYSEYIWIKKGTNPRGPKEYWVSRKCN